MLQSCVAELTDALATTTHATGEILEDLRRVLRGDQQLYDRPDPDDPEGKFAYVVTGRRRVALLQKVMEFAAAARPRYEAMLYEMGFMYLVSIFDAFLQDLFTAALLARPEALRSGKQVTYEKVVELQKSGNVIQYLAEREMRDVGYRSISEQLVYFEQKFGIDFTNSGVSISQVEEMYARRNLLAHNNGVVNSTYRERVPRARVAIGRRLTVTEAYWGRAVNAFNTIASYATAEVKERLA